MSIGIEVMRMMFEEDVTMYAGPKGKHREFCSNICCPGTQRSCRTT